MMKTLEFNQSLVEMSNEEMQNSNGGLLFLASWLITEALILGSLAVIGATIYGSYMDGYTAAQE